MKDRWTDEDDGIRKALLQVTANTEDGILNRYAAEIGDSFAADFVRWSEIDFEGERQDFDTSKEQLRTWIDKRVAWIDQNLDCIGKVHYTVTYETEQGDVFTTESVRDGTPLFLGPEAPEKPGYVFTGWTEKTEGTDHNGYKVTDDVTFIPHYVDEKTAVDPTAIFLPRYEVWTPYTEVDEEWNQYYFDDPFILPEDADLGRIHWTSSDESLLSIETPGTGIVKGTGDVDLTVTLRNGISATVRVHIYKEGDGIEPVFPTGMVFDPSSYTIGTGESIQILPRFSPQDTPLHRVFCEYESSDESVVEITDAGCGIITGKKPGKATITVTASEFLDEGILHASFEVTVTGSSGKKVSLNKAKIVLSKSAFTYNGKVQRPKIRTIGGKKLAAGKDYTLKWSRASSKGVGTYTLTITGKGNYTGTAKASYRILPKGTKIKKLKKGPGTITVKWKKQSAKMPSSRITGYQVQLAANKGFTKGKKTLSIKGWKKTSRKVSGLKKNRKYYVRIRTYKMIRGTRLYSSWSKARTVKTGK